MRDLTGAPSFSLNTQEDEEVEGLLLAYDAQGYIMAASCTVEDPAIKEQLE